MARPYHVIERYQGRRIVDEGASVFTMAIALFGLAVAAAAPAFADEQVVPAAPAGTIITIGGYGLMTPKFEGAKSDELAFRPIVSWSKPGSRIWLDLPNDGLDYEVVEGDNYRAGVVGNLRFQRNTDLLRPRGFKRVGSTDLSVEAGGFAEFWPTPNLRTRAELRDALFGAQGLIADFSADVVLFPTERLTLTGGPRLSLADQTFMDSYYSITSAQAASSGMTQFKADAGLRSYGLGASARYQLTDDIMTLAFVEYQRLSGSAGESPLIEQRGSPDQFTFGLGMKYSFHVPW